MRVAVGSSNPVKVGAVRRVFAQAFPEAEVVSLEVASRVAEQPVGEAETQRGAVNRAQAVLEAAGADFGVGLEGGVLFAGEECWMIQFGAIVHRDGRSGVGQGVRFLLPPVVGEGVRAGGEVGPLMDGMLGTKDIKKKAGAIGYLTGGLVVREEMYAHVVAAALVRFLHTELYDA